MFLQTGLSTFDLGVFSAIVSLHIPLSSLLSPLLRCLPAWMGAFHSVLHVFYFPPIFLSFFPFQPQCCAVGYFPRFIFQVTSFLPSYVQSVVKPPKFFVYLVTFRM